MYLNLKLNLLYKKHTQSWKQKNQKKTKNKIWIELNFNEIFFDWYI